MAGVEPARGDDLAAGEEVHALHAVGVAVAEEAVLPAAERVVRHRHGNRHVDAHHPDLDLVLEAPGGTTVVGEDRGAVAVGVGVDEVERLVVGLRADDREHRTEDLLVVALHSWLHVVDEARVQKEALVLGLVGAVDDDLCAFRGCVRHVARDLVAMFTADQWSHLTRRVGSRTDLDVRDASLDLVDERVGDGVDREQRRRRSPCSARRPSRTRR